MHVFNIFSPISFGISLSINNDWKPYFNKNDRNILHHLFNDGIKWMNSGKRWNRLRTKLIQSCLYILVAIMKHLPQSLCFFFLLEMSFFLYSFFFLPMLSIKRDICRSAHSQFLNPDRCSCYIFQQIGRARRPVENRGYALSFLCPPEGQRVGGYSQPGRGCS